MKAQILHNRIQYEVDLSKPLDISIPLEHHKTPIAFGAPAFEATPFTQGDFIGSIEAGSPVNFYNIKINPHGNCTHTESVKHIDARGESILETIDQQHFIARLISVTPETLDNGDRVVTKNIMDTSIINNDDIQALVIRTKPNRKTKQRKNYTNTNPVYFSKDLLKHINKTTVKHLLIDVPSVDREVDEGKLVGHKAFWNTKKNISKDKTITELIFVDNKIKDGLYLLNLQILPLVLDVSPSRPVLYALKEIWSSQNK
ncbi:cyclase family protein [Saprospiraceae bacterium]|nr:cyclase family protein [Saprospiraceae bacterium]